MTDKRKDCPMRHENGNCTVSGGLCATVNDPSCEALHNAFDCGYRSALRQQECVGHVNKSLALDELREAAETGDPVWLVGMEDGDGWVFIHHVDSCSVRYARIGTSEEWCFRTKSYGVRVWAYRQKPEEGTV